MTDTVLEAAVASTAKMIGDSFSGIPAAVAAVVGPAPDEPILNAVTEPYDFDAEFQTRVAAFAVRDDEFMRHTCHLLKPEFFEDAGVAALVNISLRHFQTYGCVPDMKTLHLSMADDLRAKIIRGEASQRIKAARLAIYSEDLTNRGFVENRVARFAKHQAMGAVLLRSIGLREEGDFDKIEKLIKEATEIGLNQEGDAYDYYKKIDARTGERMDKASGLRPPQGITTGVPKLDALLYHSGWGRKELTTIMGGAKAGKTTALINFAKAASMAGHQVLYATLEVGAGIISDRLDACVSETLMKELTGNIHKIRDKVNEIAKHAGALQIHEFASGTLTPNQLRGVIERYKTPGRNSDGTVRRAIKFDLIVVDYADIMAPNYRTQDTIENSKTVYVDLRAIAFEENAAVLTATQTNREGFKATVAKAEHVAEDFNKVRTVDLMISINKTEEEAKRGEARLYFAASRNQESGFTIVIRQRLDMMKFVDAVLGVE